MVHSRQHLARLPLPFDLNFSHCHSHNLPYTNWYSNFVSFSILFLTDTTADRPPIDLLREELSNKLFVVWPQGDWIGSRVRVRSGVQIIRVESQYILQSLLIYFIREIGVSPLSMPRIEGVVSNYVECCSREFRLSLAYRVL